MEILDGQFIHDWENEYLYASVGRKNEWLA